MHESPTLQGARRRGRPPGSKASVIRDPRALGTHHFSFVRSCLLGLDLAASFERYVAWSEATTDLRHVQARRDELLQDILGQGRQLDATLAESEKITDMLDLLRSGIDAKPAAVLPTLDEWVASEAMDPDFWSEADLQAEYHAHFGLDNGDAQDAAQGLRDPVHERVRALNHLQTLLAVVPSPKDRVETWFAKSVAKRLRNAGVGTLADLVCFLNAHGYQWHKRIQGFGAVRARKVVAWMVQQQEQLNLLISDLVHEPHSKQRMRVPELQPVVHRHSQSLALFGVDSQVARALSCILDVPALCGHAGTFRSHMPNTLGASNDVEAVVAWLGQYTEKPLTLNSYRKEAERFLLWCSQCLKKPLSSVDSVDCQQYRAFLQAVPGDWISLGSYQRTDPRWRAFRGQPSPASQKQALVILQTLYSGLVDAGYLVANPLRSVMKNFDLPVSKVNISRSFTEAEWAHAIHTLEGLPTGAETSRLRCILHLVVTSGIRLDELAKATHRDLRIETLPGLAPAWILSVTGKRNKKRDVPLQPYVVELLAAHGREFMHGDVQSQAQASLPLIRTLHASVPQWTRGVEAPVLAPMVTELGAALSASGIYKVLKRFFKQAARTAEQAGLDAGRFEKASTHWMRHTFVRQSLVGGMPIEVASELVGHASIDTTSIYASQELARKIKAIQSMPHASL
jgi:site-specific recombinase XerD